VSPAFTQLAQLLAPHLAAVALCATRLLPITFLCPFLGGQAAPITVRIGITFALALSLHFVGGVGLGLSFDGWTFAGAAVREVMLGTAIGLVASLPFDIARMGGKLIDLFRGASAEAALPVAGSREAASGDLVYQLVLAVALVGGVLPIALSGIWKSFGLVPLGTAVLGSGMVEQIISMVGTAFATGLVLGAPVAAASLATDLFVGLIARASPQISVADFAAPVKLLAGGALLWLTLGLLSDRLMAMALDSNSALHALLTAR
jgi:type III secretion protein T